MSPYDCYVAYTALKVHFNSDKYDYTKYNGKIKNANPKNYEKSGLKVFYSKLAKHHDPLGFLVANFLKNPNIWIRNIVYDTESENNYIEYSKKQEALSYTFTNDLNKLNENLTSNFNVSNNEHPLVIRLLLSSEISLETVVILVDVFNLDKYWKKFIENDVILKKVLFNVNKYKSLFKYDERKMRRILLDKFNMR